MAETTVRAGPPAGTSGLAGAEAVRAVGASRARRAGARIGDARFIACAAVVTVASVAVERAVPPGAGGGIVYLALVLLGWWLAKPGHVLLLAGLASALAVAGHLAAPDGTSLSAALANRGLTLLAIWATAALLVAAKRRLGALAQSRDALAARIGEQAARLDTTRTQAELANRSASQLFTNMSHELRTPLNAIIGFSEIVKNELFGPIGSARYRDYMTDINESGHYLLDLVNDLLDMARIETGRVALDERAVDVLALIEACLGEVAAAAEAGRVALERAPRADLPALRGDARKIRQILTNVLSNAIKFTPPGGRVEVAAWCRPDTGTVIQVSDTGIGIALKDIPVALAPFGQVDNDLRPRHAGSGLGLPLTKALIELHAGSFDLQSEPGVGTTVTLRFPAERVLAVPKVA